MSKSKPKILLIHTISEQEKEWLNVLNLDQITLIRESNEINVVELLKTWQQNKITLPSLILLDITAKVPNEQLLQISSLCYWSKANKLNLKIIALNGRHTKISQMEENWGKRQGLIDIFPKIESSNQQKFINRISEILEISLTPVNETLTDFLTIKNEEIIEEIREVKNDYQNISEFLKDDDTQSHQEISQKLIDNPVIENEDLVIFSSEVSLAKLTEAITNNPLTANLYCERGDLYFSLGNEQQALNDYQFAIQLDSKSESAYLSRGYVLSQLGDYPNAIKDLTQSIKLNSKNAIAYHYRGLARFRSGDERGAKSDYDQAIKLKPDFSQAYNDRAFLSYLLGKTNQALEDYEKAIKYQPDYADAYYNRGNIYSDLGRFEEAIADYTHTVRYNPKFAMAYGNRGIAYYELDLVKEAINDTTQAANLFHEQGDLPSYEQAIETLKQMQ